MSHSRGWRKERRGSRICVKTRGTYREKEQVGIVGSEKKDRKVESWESVEFS